MKMRVEIQDEKGKIEDVFEFIPVWLTSGKFDKCTQENMNRILGPIQIRHSIAIIKMTN